MVQVISSILSLAVVLFFKYGSIVPGNLFIKTAANDLQRQWTHCARSKDINRDSFTHPLLGHFSPRHLNCPFPTCAPETPSVIATRFIFKSRFHEKELTLLADEFIINNTHLVQEVTEYVKSDQVSIVIHGWTESFSYTPELNETVSALNHLGRDVIAVDWSHGSVDLYVGTVNAQVVGAQVAYVLQSLAILHKVECIGFSMGANVCGYASQWLKERQYSPIPRCTGLDPSPFFLQGCSNDLMLSRDDCDVVVIIHTSSAGSPASLGSDINQGHCDYWINYRRNHAGCSTLETIVSTSKKSSLIHSDKLFNQLSNVIACNHLASIRYFTQQAANYPRITFKFKECSNRYQSRYCLDDENRSQSSEYVHFMPPFDSCTRNHSELYCLCL